MGCSTPGSFVFHYLPEFAQIHVHWVGDTIQLTHPLLPTSPPALNLSQHQGLFQWVGSIRWPKYWTFSFSISPSNEYAGFISLRIHWFDLLAIQGTLKSLFQHHTKVIQLGKNKIFRHIVCSLQSFQILWNSNGNGTGDSSCWKKLYDLLQTCCNPPVPAICLF